MVWIDQEYFWPTRSIHILYNLMVPAIGVVPCSYKHERLWAEFMKIMPFGKGLVLEIIQRRWVGAERHHTK